MSDLVQWDWQRIAEAVETVSKGTVKRMDGSSQNGVAWKVYQAGAIIRVDINHQQGE